MQRLKWPAKSLKSDPVKAFSCEAPKQDFDDYQPCNRPATFMIWRDTTDSEGKPYRVIKAMCFDCASAWNANGSFTIENESSFHDSLIAKDGRAKPDKTVRFGFYMTKVDGAMVPCVIWRNVEDNELACFVNFKDVVSDPAKVADIYTYAVSNAISKDRYNQLFAESNPAKKDEVDAATRAEQERGRNLPTHLVGKDGNPLFQGADIDLVLEISDLKERAAARLKIPLDAETVKDAASIKTDLIAKSKKAKTCFEVEKAPYAEKVTSITAKWGPYRDGTEVEGSVPLVTRKLQQAIAAHDAREEARIAEENRKRDAEHRAELARIAEAQRKAEDEAKAKNAPPPPPLAAETLPPAPPKLEKEAIRPTYGGRAIATSKKTVVDEVDVEKLLPYIKTHPDFVKFIYGTPSKNGKRGERGFAQKLIDDKHPLPPGIITTKEETV